MADSNKESPLPPEDSHAARTTTIATAATAATAPAASVSQNASSALVTIPMMTTTSTTNAEEASIPAETMPAATMLAATIPAATIAMRSPHHQDDNNVEVVADPGEAKRRNWWKSLKSDHVENGEVVPCYPFIKEANDNLKDIVIL
jgi:hypothetical protein